MTPWHVLLWLVSAALAAGVGAWIGHYKGRQVQGAWMGFLAGWIGVLILVFLPKTHDRKVQEARERRQIEADALLPPPPPLLDRDARGRTITPGFERAHDN